MCNSGVKTVLLHLCSACLHTCPKNMFYSNSEILNACSTYYHLLNFTLTCRCLPLDLLSLSPRERECTKSKNKKPTSTANDAKTFGRLHAAATARACIGVWQCLPICIHKFTSLLSNLVMRCKSWRKWMTLPFKRQIFGTRSPCIVAHEELSKMGQSPKLIIDVNLERVEQIKFANKCFQTADPRKRSVSNFKVAHDHASDASLRLRMK